MIVAMFAGMVTLGVPAGWALKGSAATRRN